MDRLDIVMDAINALVPDAKYIIRENFAGLEWLDERDVPTESEVQTKYDELIAAEPTKFLREVRNAKLTETDWVITMHKELGTNIPAAWKTYRQALRDITDTYTSLNDVVWPEKPE